MLPSIDVWLMYYSKYRIVASQPVDKERTMEMPVNTLIEKSTVDALIARHGEKLRPDIARGVSYCAKVWDFKGEGEQTFTDFCVKQYVPPGKERSRLLNRLDDLLNIVGGSFGMMSKTARRGLDLADEVLTPAEEILSSFSAGTHLLEDFRTFKIAALAQLNFGTDDITPPKSRGDWAARRISGTGRETIPAELLAESSKAHAEVDRFVFGFNIHLDKIEYADPAIKFPKDTVQISHWGLRDYMTGQNGQENALARQHAIRDLMRRVVDGEIPTQILDNPKARWRQSDNTVTIDGKSEPAKMTGPLRWEKFKHGYAIRRKIDPYTRYGNIIDNKFKLEREIPEERIVGILKEILASPMAEGVGAYIASRVNRPLEAHDIYFKDFRGGTSKTPLKFDIRKRYPNADALTKAIPAILIKLGFDKKRAAFIGSKIRVDNSRSAGHAWGPSTPFDIQLLRVRIDKQGIGEQDFKVFMHELGHCVEGVLTSYEMDYKSLWGVPNTAFTEGFAFTFQDRADFVLGRHTVEDASVTTLMRFWEAYEIAGPALVEIEFFHWLYAHPNATAAEMNSEIRRIGDEVYKKYYARVFGPEGCGLMSVYSHILSCSFYLADYPMGYVIAYQVRKYLRDKNLATEMERMCKVGSIYPEQWMRSAVNQSISVKPLLDDTKAALKKMKLPAKSNGTNGL